MEIIARKRSEDPAQEKLRERKSQWNAEVKTLIAQLIAFKRGLNGRGDPRAGLPPSNIKNPFPSEIGQYLEEMATRYQKVITEAKQIISEQSDYSQKRRKGKKEMPFPVAASVENEIEKQASWWGSRAWTWFTQYPILGGKDADRDRIALLHTATALIDYIDETEEDLSKGGDDAIPSAVYKLLAMHRVFDMRFIKIFNRMMVRHTQVAEEKAPTEAPVSPEAEPESYFSPPVPDEPKEALRILEDLLLIDIHHVKKLLDIVKQLKKVSPEEYKGLYRDYELIVKLGGETRARLRVAQRSPDDTEELASAMSLYKDVLIRYNKVLNIFKRALGVNGNRFRTLLEQAEETYKREISAMYGPEIEKLAQKSLKRWWRRTRLGLFPREEDRMKRDVLLKTQELTRLLNHMQDLLEEKYTTAAQVWQHVADSSELLAEVFGMILNLSEYHNAMEADKKLKKTKQPSTKIDRDNRIKLTKCQKYYKDLSNFLQRTMGSAEQ